MELVRVICTQCMDDDDCGIEHLLTGKFNCQTMKEQAPQKEQEMTLPPNLTIAWGQSDVSYTDATYRNWVPEKNAWGSVRLVGIMRDEGNMTDAKYKEMFDKTLAMARANPKGIYHYVRLDNSKFVEQNSNNEPYSDKNHWCKTLNLWGYTYTHNAIYGQS